MSFGPSVGQPGYLPYCGKCPSFRRMTRGKDAFECKVCGLVTRRINGEDMFDRTAPAADPYALGGGEVTKGSGAVSRSREPGLASRPGPSGFDRGEAIQEACDFISDAIPWLAGQYEAQDKLRARAFAVQSKLWRLL